MGPHARSLFASRVLQPPLPQLVSVYRVVSLRTTNHGG